MQASSYKWTALLALALSVLALPTAAETLPFLSPLFGDHMVLQRDQPIRLWGWAESGTAVTVKFAGQQKTTTADAGGKWLVSLDPVPASKEPRELLVVAEVPETKIQNRRLTDILVGDVWLCSGQSNMEFDLARARDGAVAVQQSAHPSIRLFRVGSQPAYEPARGPRGKWLSCGPDAFAQPGGFSAVAYYFARQVQAETGIPIGLIQAAVGGTPAESWMSPAALQAFPEFEPALTEVARLRAQGAPAYGNFVMHWFDEYDRGVAGHWDEEPFDDATWRTTSLHDAFSELGVPATPAVVWLRRTVDLPDPLPRGPAKLMLGVVEKMDTAWINGQWVGASAWVENPRAYRVPAGMLRPGRNQLTVRVLKAAVDGGFRSSAEALKLVLGDGTPLPLENGWRAALGVDARPPHPLPLGYENWPTMPGVLELGMLEPLAPLGLAGVLWYQGEANHTRAAQYRKLLPALIEDWRRLFGEPDLPFYLVSLPAFMARRDQPAADAWTELREAQLLTARAVPNTGAVVTIDTGDANDIHPVDKQPVGERLARLALHHTYGRDDIVSEGPTLTRAEPTTGGFRLHFDHVEEGLVAKGPLNGFAVAGADRNWHWAEARLEGDTVIVSSNDVPAPVAVRYAWQANPYAPLFNGAGLPAAPFRTDNW